MSRSRYPLLMRLHARLISLPLTIIVLASFFNDALRFYGVGVSPGDVVPSPQVLAMKYTVLFVMVWMVRRSVRLWQSAEATLGPEGLSFNYRGRPLWTAKWKSIRKARVVNKPFLKVMPRISLEIELSNRKMLVLPLSPMSIPMPNLNQMLEEIRARGVGV